MMTDPTSESAEATSAAAKPSMPNITEVHYGRLVSGPGYNHEKLEATAAVNEGDDPNEVLRALKGWVNRQVDPQMRQREQLLEQKRAEAARLWRQMRDLRLQIAQEEAGVIPPSSALPESAQAVSSSNSRDQDDQLIDLDNTPF